MTRGVVALVLAVWLALWPTVVAADAPGPTDYRSVVVAVEPPAPTVTPAIIGGDSFFSLRVEPGTAVEVPGYRGEPYLRFLASGEVQENRRSVTYFQSRSRYGSTVPEGVDADTVPEWRTVATDGRYAWHDHRTHWMNPAPPLGAEPGDVVLEARVRMIVDGRDTVVVVSSTWLPAPSPVATWLGLAAGAVLAAVVGWRRRSPIATAVIAGVTGIAALLIGVWQFRLVPAETGPSPIAVALPAVALAVAAASIGLRRWWAAAAWAALVLAGVELAIWGWSRRDGLSAAILPTDAPFWLDRAVTAGVLVAGTAVAAVALVGLFGTVGAAPPRHAATAPPP